MGMIAHLRQVEPEVLAEIKNKPSLARELLLKKTPEMEQLAAQTQEMFSRYQRTGVFQRMVAARTEGKPVSDEDTRILEQYKAELLKQSAAAVTSIQLQDDDPSRLRLEKSWQVLHFLLTGKSEGGAAPLADAVLGGKKLRGTETGYGPIRYLEPGEVKSVAAALGGISTEALLKRFDLPRMRKAQIYTADEDSREEVAYFYPRLVDFYGRAAREGRAVLLAIS